MAGTCYLPNGQTVKASQSACVAGGGNFVPDSEESTPIDSRGFAQKYWEDTSTGGKLLDASMFIPLGGLGIAAGRGAYAGLRNSKKIGDLMGKGFKKLKSSMSTKKGRTYADTAANRAAGRVGKPKYELDPSNPIYKDGMPKYNKYKRKSGQKDAKGNDIYIPANSTYTPRQRVGLNPKLNAQGKPIQQTVEELSRLKMGGTALGVGGLAAGNMMGSGMIPNQGFTDRQNQISSNMSSQISGLNNKEIEAANAQATTKAEADRVAGLNPLEAMMENMKKPGYWTDPMNEGGPASDNRLNRMGQLMNYYGSTPKQRAAMGDPQKGFIKTEQTLADNQAAFAKAQATLTGQSPFGTLGTTGIAKGLEALVKERYDSFFGGIDDEDVAGVAARVASTMQILAGENPLTANKPGGVEQIREAAFKQVEKELGL